MGAFILAIFTLISWFIMDRIFPGTGGLAIFGTFAACAASFGYVGIKAVLKVKAGDNAGAELPKLSTFGLGFVGAILVFFYNIIGLVIFDQRFWYELNGKIFILILMSGILVYVVALIFIIFFYSRNLAKEKGVSLLGGFVAFIELMYNDYKKLKKNNPSLGEDDIDI